MDFLSSDAAGPVLLAVLLVGIAVAAAAFMRPGYSHVDKDRLRAPKAESEQRTALTGVTERLIAWIAARSGGPAGKLATSFDLAGIDSPVSEVLIMMGAGGAVAIAAGTLIGGLGLGLGLGLLTGAGCYLYIRTRIGRVRAKFGDTLDDTLETIANSLKQGYSLPQALSIIAEEDGEPPMSDEFARVINRNRLGKPLADALDEMAERMQSEDFRWVTQAIAINREVGGSLADVLFQVVHTIRERAQLRRQVKSLAAEGKLSGIIMMALPFVVFAVVNVTSPDYLASFTSSTLGYTLIAAGIAFLIVGGIWMRSIITIKY